MQRKMEKFHQLSNNLVAACTGDDAVSSGEFFAANIKLMEIMHNTKLSHPSIARFIRHEIAKALRKRPMNVNSMLCGCSPEHGPYVASIDYLGTLAELDHTCFGVGANFAGAT